MNDKMKNRRHQACLAWSDARDTRRFGIEVWARGENRVGVKTRSLTRGKNKKKKRRIGTEAPPGPNANHFFFYLYLGLPRLSIERPYWST